LAIALAKHWNTIIFSADSRQFYQEIEIGTAKPSKDEQAGITHYFIDSHSIHSPLSAAQFEKEALPMLEQKFQQHDKIILVGGSGLFIDAVCNGLDDVPKNETIKQSLIAEFQENGLSNLVNELKLCDPEYSQSADLQNPARVIRALEVYRCSGIPFSKFHLKQKTERFFSVHKFVINLPREILYDRINKRVDLMLNAGLLEEVKQVEKWKNLTALQTVGYTEFFQFLAGECSYERAIELVKQNTRRYAKRQLTWFRRDATAIWLQSINTENQQVEIIQEIQNIT
jgi:tRNA dimethylallyltransferase